MENQCFRRTRHKHNMVLRKKQMLILSVLCSSAPSSLSFLRTSVLHTRTTTTSIILAMSAASSSSSSTTTTTTNNGAKDYYRSDGVRMGFDPYAAGVAEKYGLEGGTDPEGFDPYADTVGPGIYGGSVQRDRNDGTVVMGRQYQNHNRLPGPVYDGKGYSLMSRAVHAGPNKVRELLKDFPQLNQEVTTGGARPLHICGMSRRGQLATQVLIDAGADLAALDTYNYNALHRMASNDLEIGGEALVKAGLDPNYTPPGSDSSPMETAQQSRAMKFLTTMEKLGHLKP